MAQRSSNTEQTSQTAGSSQARTVEPRVSDPIILVCATDENYAMPMAVMAYSALVNLNKQQQILLYVLDGGIREATKRKVLQTLNSHQIDVRWLKPDPTLFQNLSLPRDLTMVTYYRVLMPQIFPNYDKVIYLDCDMIVRGDLAELWQIDIGDHYFLAVQDDNQFVVANAVGLPNYRELGLQPDQKYFNAGLLVVNLQKWREEEIGTKVIEFCGRHSETIRDADQDGLNAVSGGNWGQLNSRWNQMPRVYCYESWQESPYDESGYQQLRDDPYIIHYTNAPKPWRQGCQHPARDLFLSYLDQTAWTGWRDTWWRQAVRKAGRGWRKLKRGIAQLN